MLHFSKWEKNDYFTTPRTPVNVVRNGQGKKTGQTPTPLNPTVEARPSPSVGNKCLPEADFTLD